ncbi:MULTISPECIES: TrbC family F-type conjugative pilus assembly protein [Vibrio]|nr:MULTISPECIES: TrbC family F-type conjugative pilus assembly protein [Vibrio]BAU70863.1 hypothetical protein [Vibrio sp. 04Ya108]BBM67568.1 hypothetical protein VA249_42140 [Vibrio alfacsensis]BCN27051.1 hypothetical protein VYA_42430 [Vibrio alfacsensis]
MLRITCLLMASIVTSFTVLGEQLREVKVCATINGEIKCDVGMMELDPSDEKFNQGLMEAKEIIDKPVNSQVFDDMAKEIARSNSTMGIGEVTKPKAELTKEDIEAFKVGTSFNQPIEKGFWELAQKAGRLLDRAINKKQNGAKYGNIDGFIFISQTIPENDLASLIYEVSQSKEKIAFVIRGAEPMRYAETLKHFIDIEKEIVGRFMVDPTLFRKLNITEVPTFVLKNENDKWQKTSGNVSLSAVRTHFKEDKKLRQLGKVYDISEPDLILLMQERAGQVDWEEWMLEQTKQILTNRYESGLKVADEPSSLLIDPRYQIQKDIVLKGQTFGKKGQWINPLEIQPLTKCYVVADFSNDEHLRAVDELIKDCPGVTALTVKQPDYETQIPALVLKYGEIRSIDPLFIKRFKLVDVPVVARQEGLAIRLTTLPPIEKREVAK